MGIREAIQKGVAGAAVLAVTAVLAVPAAAQTVDPAQGGVVPEQGIGTAVKQSCGYGKKAKGKHHKKKQSCARNPKRNG